MKKKPRTPKKKIGSWDMGTILLNCPICDEISYYDTDKMPLVSDLDIYFPRKCISGHTFYSKESTPSERDFEKIQRDAENILYEYTEFEEELKEYTDEKRKAEAIRKRNLPSNIKKRKREAQKREKEYKKAHHYKYKDMGYKVVKKPEDKTTYKILKTRRKMRGRNPYGKKEDVTLYIPVDDRGKMLIGKNKNL